MNRDHGAFCLGNLAAMSWPGYIPLAFIPFFWTMDLTVQHSSFRTIKQIPIDGYGEDKNLRYLVMTRLGPDILTAKEAANEDSEPWSESRTAGYALQMLKILRALHERCEMVFVDVKPGESKVCSIEVVRVSSIILRSRPRDELPRKAYRMNKRLSPNVKER